MLTTTQPAPFASRRAVPSLFAAVPMTKPPPWIHISTGSGPSLAPAGLMIWQGTPSMVFHSLEATSGISGDIASIAVICSRRACGVMSPPSLKPIWSMRSRI